MLLLSRGQRLVVGEVEECVIVSIKRIRTHLELKVLMVSGIKTAIAAEVEVIVVDVAASEEVVAEEKTIQDGTEAKLQGTVETMVDIGVKEDIVVRADTKAEAVVEATTTTTTQAEVEVGAIAATTPAEVTITTSVVDAAEGTPDRRATPSLMPREKRSTNRNNSSNNRLELIDS